ncbi:Acylamino-acid-releasing enzyme [Zancudomyces culisetae]|uniref:acylaminoacyl-peptidase n=1 Tax=Zancudomyces culisetae TaxID=1213189 RepID=A0A1R1PCE5_ZANCU|nr:Acylamino-acid-releasing enzyme [Zancudomyces culisetae]|eukprot:OMH78634.1 Acylamino-acid-releasing enzyme [Zancudomyces culisetae]
MLLGNDISEEFALEVRKNVELIYGIPNVSSAYISKTKIAGMYNLEYETKQLDFVRDTARTNHHQCSITFDSGNAGQAAVVSQSGAIEMDGILDYRYEPTSGNTRKVVLKSTQAKGTEKRYVEIWNSHQLERCLDVTDIHGKFYTDETFGSLEWSHSGKYIVYMAEPKEFDAAKPIYKLGSDEEPSVDNKGKDKEKVKEKPKAGMADQRKYEFNEDYGETFTGKRPPVMVLVDIYKNEVRQVEGELAKMRGVQPGQPRWVKRNIGNEEEKEFVIFTGYKVEPRHIGLVYCTNRPSDLYICDVEGCNVKCVTKSDYNARSPRPVIGKASEIVYLSTKIGGPHANINKLMHLDLDSLEITEIVPEVHTPSQEQTESFPSNFPGLYFNQLPRDPWMEMGSGNKLLFCSSIWYSNNVLLAIDICKKKVFTLSECINNQGSTSFLTVCDDGTLVVSISTPNQVPDIYFGTVSVNNNGNSVCVKEWIPLGLLSHTETAKMLKESVEHSIVKFPENTKNLEVILTKPKSKNDLSRHFHTDDLPPLAIYPHGGPHATCISGLSAIPTILTMLGFAVAQVNYTGSLGFGQDAVNELIGKIGELEVDETVYVAKDLAENKKLVSKEKWVYNGGSHSGFMGAHIAGKYPGLFKAIVLRNPVINLGEMISKTDIPDWCFNEIGLEFDYDMIDAASTLLTPENYKKMWESSPQRFYANVTDPVLLNIGAGDRRVPPEQGYQYHRLLKANKKCHTECRVYPNVGHPLDTVEAIRDSVVGFVLFYYRFLS